MNTAGKRSCRGTVRSALCVALCMALYAALPTAQAQTATATESLRQYDIPAGSLSTALGAWGAQSDRQLVFAPDLVAGKQSHGVSGRYGPEQALTQLLAGTGLAWERVDGQTYALKQAPPPTNTNQKRVPKPEPASSAATQKIKMLDTVTVTGTRIRGGATPSPVITIGSEQIQEEGFADLGEVIRSIPQNFNGGQNPGVGAERSGSGGVANQNATGGSALNLRGLGPDATLTLLNGRRLAYDGVAQAVDISAIPVEAVDRIEIVPDGASAIYGSDAVGGVANVILKRDYEGVTVGARYGGATEGGLATHEYTLTGGTRWSSGGLIATYKDTSTDPLYARQRDYTAYMFDPSSLYPGSDLRSGLVGLHQSIGDSVELRLDAFKTHRQQDTYPYNTGLSPSYYHVATETTTSMVSPSIQIYLAGDWTLSIGGSWGKDESVQDQSRVDIATGAPTTIYHSCSCNDAFSYEIGAEGALFAMSGGDARLAVGAGARRNEFVQSNYLAGTNYAGGDESSRFAYAELGLPLVGSNSGVAGVHRLELTGAVRGEDYDSFGSITTPKLGLIYDPNSDFTLKTSWGKSFKAPTLFQLYQVQVAELFPPSFFGGAGYDPDATVLSLWGGNPDLEAERATSWTVAAVFHPEALPALEAELTWFDIDYTNRVEAPITTLYGSALNNPRYAQFIDYSPTVQGTEEAIASASAFYNYAGKPYDPDDVVAIIYAQNFNVARQHIKGLDLSSSYRFDLGPGHLAVRGSATWLDSSQQNTSEEDAYEIAGTLFNPAKIKGRLGAVWSQGGFAASTFVNYTGGVMDTANGRKTASFTTFDATLRYATGQGGGALSGMAFALSAQNLLNRNPPLHEVPISYWPPYDSTNYSAIGRFLNLSITKHW